MNRRLKAIFDSICYPCDRSAILAQHHFPLILASSPPSPCITLLSILPSPAPLTPFSQITDPEAFRRMVAEMQEKARLQSEVSERREQERAKREGDNYLPPEERARKELEKLRKRQGPPAADGSVEVSSETSSGPSAAGTFDPEVDYYGALGLERSCSAAEVRAAYRRVALLYHPDKHTSASGPRRDAIQERFLAAREASRVLSNEALRAAYDRVLDFRQASGGGKGALPALSDAERSMIARGAGELARLRRQGPTLGPAPDRPVTLALSLEELDAGGAGELELDVRRVDARGIESTVSLPLAVPFKVASRPGDVVRLVGAGDEAVDASRGDVVVSLVAKPHRWLRPRAGSLNDLDVFAGTAWAEPVDAGEETERALADLATSSVPPLPSCFWLANIATPDRSGRLLVVPLVAEALTGGAGRAHTALVPRAALRDRDDPFRAPRGDLHVTVRVPGRPTTAAGRVCSLLAPRGALLAVGGGTDAVAGAIAGGAVRDALRRDRDRRDIQSCSSDRAELGSQRGHGRRAASHVVVLCGAAAEQERDGRAESSALATSADFGGPVVSQAAAISRSAFAALAALDPRLLSGDAGVQLSVVSLAADVPVLEEEALAIADADVLIIDDGVAEESQTDSSSLPLGVAREAAFEALWRGVHVLAIGRGVQALGASGGAREGGSAPDVRSRCALPWYLIRASDSSTGGWNGLRAALRASAHGTIGVGVLEGGVASVDPATGRAETLLVPPRSALVRRARAESAVELDEELEEALDDYGFLAAFEAPEV